MMEDLRKKYPDFIIMTATQLPKENNGCEPIRHHPDIPNCIIVDYIDLIKNKCKIVTSKTLLKIIKHECNNKS